MALLDEVGTWVVGDATLNLVLGTSLFLGLLPDAPDRCVALFESGGPGPTFTQGTDPLPTIVRPRVQMFVRGAEFDYQTARTLAESVWRRITSVINQELTSVLYQRISAVDHPTLAERPDDQRLYFVANFDVWKALG